jgi:hypothetical protein
VGDGIKIENGVDYRSIVFRLNSNQIVFSLAAFLLTIEAVYDAMRVCLNVTKNISLSLFE